MGLSLDEAAVRHVAELARLKISDEEVARFADELSRILDYFGHLNELNTDNVPPTAHALPISNVLREDRVRPPWDQDRALANAPQLQDAFFQVPKVLDRDDA